MDARTFKDIVALIYQQSGIHLGPHKEALVHARIRKRLVALRLTDFRSYYDHVSQDESGNELVELLNAISTNFTHFFRENRHFEFLAKIMTEWEAAGQTRFRIWCCASSTGEEPYSIAITLREALKDCRNAKILATDISTKVLAKAKEGAYTDKHIETVPPFLLLKYFTAKDDRYVVNAALQNMLTFARINLSTPPFPLRGPLDVVFCRNVMIYFDNEVRRRLLSALYDLVKPGGYLIVGHAESLSGLLSDFKSVQPSIYVKK